MSQIILAVQLELLGGEKRSREGKDLLRPVSFSWRMGVLLGQMGGR